MAAAKKIDELEEKMKGQIAGLEERFVTNDGRFTTLEGKMVSMEETLQKLVTMVGNLNPNPPLLKSTTDAASGGNADIGNGGPKTAATKTQKKIEKFTDGSDGRGKGVKVYVQDLGETDESDSGKSEADWGWPPLPRRNKVSNLNRGGNRRGIPPQQGQGERRSGNESGPFHGLKLCLDNYEHNNIPRHEPVGMSRQFNRYGQHGGHGYHPALRRPLRRSDPPVRGRRIEGWEEEGGWADQMWNEPPHFRDGQRVRKLELPVFEGHDVLGWLNRAERYFRINRLTEREGLEAIELCLEGEALTWYEWEENEQPFMTWREFRERLLERFQGTPGEQLLEQFLCIEQSTTVREYRKVFEALASRVQGVSDETKESTFIKGLKPDIKATLRLWEPRGLRDVMRLAQRIEDTNLVGRTEKGGFKKMTEEEYQEKKAKGLCFRCDEKFTKGHRCSSPALQVLLVDNDDDEGADFIEVVGGDGT